MDVSRSVVVGTAIGVVLSVYFIKKLYRTTRTNRTSEDHLSRHKRTARRPEGEETEVEVIKVAGQVSGVALSSSRRNRPHHLDSDRRSLLFVCSLYCAADDDLLAQDIKNYPSILGNIVITDVAKSDPWSGSLHEDEWTIKVLIKQSLYYTTEGEADYPVLFVESITFDGQSRNLQKTQESLQKWITQTAVQKALQEKAITVRFPGASTVVAANCTCASTWSLTAVINKVRDIFG